VLALLYYVVSEAAMAATPGKRMLGLEVVRDDGSRLGLGRSLGATSFASSTGFRLATSSA